MTLETERLKLVPLTSEQLKLWTENIPELEKELHCIYCAEPMQGIFLEIVKDQILKIQNYPSWYTFWFIIRKCDGIVVGSAVFKDVPNQNDEVEIGYGLGENFLHKGYMTETVKAMCNFALQQKNISHVIAETESDGFASQQILQRCGFEKISSEETIWWKL